MRKKALRHAFDFVVGWQRRCAEERLEVALFGERRWRVLVVFITGNPSMIEKETAFDVDLCAIQI